MSPHPSSIRRFWLWILLARRGISKGRYDGQNHFSLKGSASFPCLKTAASKGATRSITSTITSSARSSITLTLFTRFLSADGRAAASMQTDLIQLLLSIPLAEAASSIFRSSSSDRRCAMAVVSEPQEPSPSPSAMRVSPVIVQSLVPLEFPALLKQ